MPRLLPALLPAVAFALAVSCGASTAVREAPREAPFPPRPAPADTGVWTLVWQDEFDRDGLPDPARWTYDTGSHGFGNNERQTYLADNAETARVANGQLVITTSRVQTGGQTGYRSARLKTMGRGAWRYGRVEVRAKLPAGRGTWPAIWMLPESNTYGGWPASGEIDIMEHVGFDPGVVHGTVHTGAFNHRIKTHKGKQVSVPDFATAFHVYGVEWTASQITFSVDGAPYFVFANTGRGPAEWPFDQPFHLILNTAVGGDWGGQRGIDDGVFPQQFLVDYVRVYQRR